MMINRPSGGHSVAEANARLDAAKAEPGHHWSPRGALLDTVSPLPASRVHFRTPHDPSLIPLNPALDPRIVKESREKSEKPDTKIKKW